jgi:archaellum biogenesis ATPase FlaH
LTEASIFITKATIKGNVDFIIVDSISGILRYNNEKITMRFVEYVISKIKSVNTIGIFAIDGSDFNKPIVKVIKDLADGVVK